MKRSKLIIAACALVFILFAGCKTKVDPGTGNGGNGGNSAGTGGTSNPVPSAPAKDDPVNVTPEDLKDPYITASVGKRANALDFIFNNMTLGTTTLKMRRSEWNQMLRNFDYFYKNENLVKVENYTYEKDGETWNLVNCGIRLRGNTSRYKPQGKTYPKDETDHLMPNAEWSKDFYNYAANCPDSDYRQAHFKVDFEPDDGQDRKMANCMKGVALKRNDGSYTRELLCYDIFRKNGIWTAPRASHTRVLFQFIEDLDSDGKRIDDISDCTVTDVDFGVYEMFEEVNKQSLKARDKDEITGKSVWKNSKGDLWKCAGGNLANAESSMFAEDIRITDFDETKEPKEPKAYIYESPTYDLKSNKDQVDRASEYFRGFIRELGELKNTAAGTEAGTAARKAFYEKWFDTDLFIKTYAINVSVGMDDDYWGNANNYYLYFDNSDKGTQKCYLIPFDYDNTLGNSIMGTGAENNVFAWGRGEDRPLMDRLLEVPEYYQKYKNYLLSVTDYNNENCPSNNARVKQMFEHFQDLVRPYYRSPDLSRDTNTSPSALWLSDDGGYNATKYYLAKEPYYFEQMHKNTLSWSKELPKEITFNLNGGNISGNTGDVKVTNVSSRQKLSEFGITPERDGYIFRGWTVEKDGDELTDYNTDVYVYAKWGTLAEIKTMHIYELKAGMEGFDEDYEGIQIGILNIPDTAAIRNGYLNGSQVYNKGFYSNETGVVIPPEVTENVWRYPYVESGKTYKIKLSYSNSSYSGLGDTNEISVTAASGLGEYIVSNSPAYTMENDKLKFATLPEFTVNGEAFTDGHYVLELTTESWAYQSWNWIGSNKELQNFNLNERVEKDIKKGQKLMFSLYYVMNTNDRYRCYVYDYGDTLFTLENDPPHIELSTDPSYEGIIVTMPPRPENTFIRRIYINDNLVSDIRSYSEELKDLVLADEWRYPYTTAGNKYKVEVRYFNPAWSGIGEYTAEITAVSGLGENKMKTTGVYKVENNVITWTTQPQVCIGGSLVSEENTPGYYLTEFVNQNGRWYGDRSEGGYELESYNIVENMSSYTVSDMVEAGKTLKINLSYEVGSNYDPDKYPYGHYLFFVDTVCSDGYFEIVTE